LFLLAAGLARPFLEHAQNFVAHLRGVAAGVACERQQMLGADEMVFELPTAGRLSML
jgi:hypothetical protein